jgi:hypothetical protein
LPFRQGEATLDEFVEFISEAIVEYCIPRAKRDEAKAQFEQDGEYRHIVRLHQQACRLFVTARKQLPTSGEPGELILFLLLEAALGAPQVACKMFLKTSERMNVHGTDGIHVLPSTSPGGLRIIWGESKLDQDLSTGLDRICDSLASFISRERGRTGRDRDVDILRDHTSVTDPVLRQALRDAYDPYHPSSNLREESYACFLGFDYSLFNQLGSLDPEAVEPFFCEKYEARIRSAYKLFADKLQHTKLERLELYFLLIPFPSIELLRRRFFQALGVVQ